MTNCKPEHLGTMIDMSGNSVMNMDTLKRFLTLLKKRATTPPCLYTEDIYEIKWEPHFGYMRGRYSIEEMKEIDTFTASIGVEIIPCVQTLAHLATLCYRKQHSITKQDFPNDGKPYFVSLLI